MIVTVTLTPALDKTVVLPDFELDRVNRIERLRLDPGGKGINVSKVLKFLGADSLATGLLGGDTGRYIDACLQDMGIRSRFVWQESPTRTNLKVIDPVRRTNTDINEPGAPADERQLREVFDIICEAAQPDDLVVLAGKAPPGAPDTIFADWIEALNEKGLTACLDADGALLQHAVRAKPALIKPNDQELARLTGRALGSLEELARTAKELCDGGIGFVTVSLGGDGALFVLKDQALYAKGLSVPVQSTVGAGDSMMAALVYGIEKGLPMEDMCALSVAVSAASVMTPGTQTPEQADVDRLLKEVRLTPVAL